MKLSRALLCINCDEVVSAQYEVQLVADSKDSKIARTPLVNSISLPRFTCPSCGSSHLYPLHLWIGALPYEAAKLEATGQNAL